MSDIIKRLRRLGNDGSTGYGMPIASEAADVIENQRNRLETYAAGVSSDISRAMIKVADEQRTRIAELERELAEHRKALNAAKNIIAGQENRILRMTEHNLECVEAVTSLQSEREANALLTNELTDAQAREKVLRYALYNYKSLSGWFPEFMEEVLSMPIDDTALRAALKAERERIAQHIGGRHWTVNSGSRFAEEIRALED